MARKKFKVTKRNVVFSKGPIHLVDCDVQMPGGKTLSRQILEHPGSVVIIPKVAGSRYILIKQFRFAVKSWIWEFPAGGVEPGENKNQAARRELIEEIGFKPGVLTHLMDIFPTPGISGERMHLFLAENMSPASAEGDEDEEIQVAAFSRAQIIRMIQKGTIKDAKTIAGFLYLEHFGDKRKRVRGRQRKHR